MAVLRFEPNQPLEVALKYDRGKRVKSRIPNAADQVMFTLCGDDTIYVPLIVADQIEQLGIRKMELISICKRQQNNVTRWEVRRLSEASEPAEPPAPAPAVSAFPATLAATMLPTAIDASPIERKLTQSINQVNMEKAQRTSTLSKATPAAPATSTGESTTQQINRSTPLAITGLSQLLAGCMLAAIDSAVIARDYAHSKGLTISLSEQSIQDLTSTLMIHLQRMAELECKFQGLAEISMNRVQQNGGVRWRQ